MAARHAGTVIIRRRRQSYAIGAACVRAFFKVEATVVAKIVKMLSAHPLTA